jgi:hypothetical protein
MDQVDEGHDSPVSAAHSVGTQRRWGQSELCRLSNAVEVEEPRRLFYSTRPWYESESRRSEPEPDPYVGPIENWPNYRVVNSREWQYFNEHQIVYTDGSNVEGIEPGWFYCKLCLKKCSTKDIAETHVASAKHERNVDWFRTTNPGQSLTTASLTATVSSPSVLTAEDQETLRLNRCVIEEDWIVCTLCNKKLSDMSFVPMHIGTQKHRNNLEWANSVDGAFCPDVFHQLPEGMVMRDSDYYCTICDASMTSKSVVDVHVSGPRHCRPAVFEDLDIPIRRGIPIARLVEVLGPATYETPIVREPRQRFTEVGEPIRKPQPPAPQLRQPSIVSSRSSGAPSRGRIPSPPRNIPPPLPLESSLRWNAPRTEKPKTTTNYCELPDLIQIDV